MSRIMYFAKCIIRHDRILNCKFQILNFILIILTFFQLFFNFLFYKKKTLLLVKPTRAFDSQLES